MRITASAKERTRERLLDAARQRFDAQGFSAANTRDIAKDAGLAAGTLFNYFPNKESLAMTVIGSELAAARETWRARRRPEDTLVEDLFSHVATGLRALQPHRAWVGEVLETGMSPFATGGANREGDAVRAAHLEGVHEILAAHGAAEPATGDAPSTALTAPGVVGMHLYWTLYLGVLAWWSGDPSEHQADTLVVLDRSLQLFVASLRGAKDTTPGVTDAASTESQTPSPTDRA